MFFPCYSTQLLFLVYNYEAYYLPIKKKSQNSKCNGCIFASWVQYINLTDQSPFMTSAYAILGQVQFASRILPTLIKIVNRFRNFWISVVICAQFSLGE